MYKFVLHDKLVEGEPEQHEVFLVNLEDDPSEEKNLADQMPALAQELRQKVESWQTGIDQSGMRNRRITIPSWMGKLTGPM